MSKVSRSLFISAALVISPNLPVHAQQLAETVIEEYFTEMGQSGLTVTPGNKSVSGKTVEWTDIVFGLPADGGSFTLPFIRAEEIGGGQVSVTYPENLDIRIDAKGEQPAMDIGVQSVGANWIISGDAAARTHAMDAESIVISLSSPEPGFSMRVDMTDTLSNQVNSGSDIRNYKGDFKAAEIKVAYGIDDGEVKMSSDSAYNNLSGSFDVDLISEENIGDLLSGKRNMSIEYAMGSGSSTTVMDQPEFAGTIAVTGEGGSGAIGVRDGIFAMTGDATNANYELTFAEIPLPPFQASFDSVSAAMSAPLKKTDAVLPAAIKFNFSGIKASDTLWGMVDPTGSLPRDKANLNIDLSANLKWLVDLMKIDEANAMPVEVQDVSINDVTLEIAGARLNGVGAATINNATMPPMPVGELNLDLKGGVGLLDKLMALGLVPQEQGAMVKAMSGMFTLPGGDGTDHLTSKIEMQEGGAILANGQRIK
ncbi:MAG: DUF2125 domain-containing protein [Rhodobacteraceae bacterium]|nr:DUF2125 domain-containing protein [Paracoccaceae bacterium]